MGNGSKKAFSLFYYLFSWGWRVLLHFEICPDRTAHNKKVHDLFRSLSSFHVSYLDILRGRTRGAFWWDIWMRCGEIKFICTIHPDWRKEVIKHIENTWPLCSIEEVKTPVIPLSDVCEMKYRRSDIFALQIDRRLELEPLNSILSIAKDLGEHDAARVSICAEPIGRLDWQDVAERKHKEFREGRTPKRRRIRTKDIIIGAVEGITNTLQSAMDTVDRITGYESEKGKESDLERRIILLDGNLTKGTLNKRITPTFNTYIRIASHSLDPLKKQVILRTLSNSFNDLTADNELERIDFHSKIKPIILRELETYQISLITRLDFDKNVMSNEELGRLVELPTAALQDEFRQHMETLDSRQIEVPTVLTKGGLLVGEVSFKKITQLIYTPINDHDDLCYSSVIIAKKGQGKTKGFTCNRAVEFVKQGYSAIIFDVADSEAWEVIEKALPPEKRQRIQLGKIPISLDFSEIKHSPEAKGRLAEIIMSFFEDNTDTAGAQTQRFLRAAVMGMQTGRLAEIIRILRDKDYRQQAINKMPNGTPELENFHKVSLQEFGKYEEGRQRQILSPILNRLDVILGSPYLNKCLQSDNSLDMLSIIKKKGMCTVFDIPDELNSRIAKDVLVSLLSFKLDIATPLRPKKERFPVAVFYDEPHQYLRSAKIWKNFVAEARKYRLAYHFLFHSWGQIPNDLTQIIKDAGVHYFIYPSGEDTFKGLQRIIHPFTIDDGLNLKKFHAICILNVGESRLTPFIAHMAPPPG